MSSSGYNPRDYGALCDRCPLNGQKFVAPEFDYSNNPNGITIVGESPNKVEADNDKMFAGPAGAELDKALRMGGIKRHGLHVTNVVLCQAPGKDLKTFLQKLSRYNQKMRGPGEPEVPSPIECCKPRFEKEIDGKVNFITLGRTANYAVSGNPSSIMSVRGGLVELEATDRTPARRVMPTLPPALLLHQMKYAHVFRNDIAKAGRWFRGEAKFEPPEILWHPNASDLRTFLFAPGKIYAFDLETDGIDNLTTKIRCIGIGDRRRVALVGLLGKDGFTKFYSYEEEKAVIEVLKEYFADPKIQKIAHNGLNFDNVVLLNQIGVRPQNVIDTMLLHKSVESELPHGLGYVVSLYAEAPSWKNDREGNKLSTASESDVQLHEYCVLDVSLTERVAPALVEQVKLRGQYDVWKLDQQIQQVCAEMHMTGMYVDQKARLEIEIKLLKRRQELLNGIRERLENDKFNPNSTDQMRDLLFGKWKLTPPLEEEDRFTSTGDPSTADLILRSLLSEELPDHQREIIKRIRYYRKVIKVLGTYVTKLRPSNVRVEDDLGWDDEDEDWIDRETRKKYGLEKTGIVNPLTGRMYPGYSVGTPVTGRLSSSKPLNAQNFPKNLRKMVTAAPGNVLVGADMDQLELRIAAARWNVDLYLRAFAEQKDPHSMTAYAVFGDEFCKAAGVDPACFAGPGKLVGTAYDDTGKFKGEGEAVKLRNLSKAVQYACVAGDEEVVVLDTRGTVPIKDLVAQKDWTWCWSTERNRYEPAQIIAVVNQGVKECVEVKFEWWAGAAGGLRSESLVTTADHLFLLRDGTFRQAGDLRPDDRLMPFRRRIGTSDYRYVFPFNTDFEVSEHRAIKGFYEVGERETHVHHKDQCVQNNHPDNLEILHYLDHYQEHKDDIDAGRRNSIEWYNAVSNPETRSKASKVAWANRRANVAAGRQDKTFGPRPSVLDAVKNKIGVLTDEDIAKLAGCTATLVGMYRKQHQIPPPPGQKGWLRWLLTENAEWRAKLETMTDTEIVREVKKTYNVDFERTAVRNTRKLLGIEAPEKERIDKDQKRSSKLDPWSTRIGHEHDKVIAAEAGCTEEAVTYYRKSRGIPAYWREAPGGTNHAVVSVTPVGPREVWDIEVDHEDHNFAVKAGVFVHNSQYMAKVETVHKLIQKTEVENKDGTTDLPYAKLPLRQVREMHSNWLKGAPEFETGWEMEINTYRRLGYLAEPITGRRRDFLDGEAPNEIVNFNIQCVPGHVRVLTKDGYIPIRELQGKQFVAWTGIRWAPATCISKGLAELREVRTTHAIHLVCDATHKFKVPDRSEYIWKTADDLICNQRVAIDLARELEFGSYVDAVDAYVLGFYIADGCLSRKNKGHEHGVSLSFAVGHKAATGRPERCGDSAIQRLLNWGESRGLHGRLVVETGHTSVCFERGVQYWCDSWGLSPGLKARDKKIPEAIWRADLEARKQFVLGVLDGDAHQTPDGNVILNMCNPDFLEELAVLVRTIGIDSMSMHEPYKTNAEGESVSWRLALSGAHVNRILGWGRECKYRSNNTIPQFECKRIVDRLRPTTASHRTMKSRIKETRHGGAGSITPYSAVEMGVTDLYDHAVTTATVKLDVKAEVFTLCVDDPDHQYVANGFISKNSTAAGLMNLALLRLVSEVPYQKWGPGTGIINQCHDAIVIECPADGCSYTVDEKGKKKWDIPKGSIPYQVARLLEDCLRAEHPSLPGVVFTASADIDLSWDKV